MTERIFAGILALVGFLDHSAAKVWVIAKSHLRRFWECRLGDSEVAQGDLLTWFKLAESAEWANFGALKQTFGLADQVGNCVVFDVGNNRFRLIGRVFYAAGELYILRVMDHQEYDKGRWVDDCGCYDRPPLRHPEVKISSAARERKPRRRKRGK